MNHSPTFAQRTALQAVHEGRVTLDHQGCRSYPHGVHGMSLTTAMNAGWWKWRGDEAVLTPQGRLVLGVPDSVASPRKDA